MNESKVKSIDIKLTAIFILIFFSGFLSSFYFMSEESSKGSIVDEDAPLYWVAPMDDNYRRDKPGQSPMGMDLVPVFKKGNAEISAGTVMISPEVVNNLGVRTSLVKKEVLSSKIKTVGYVNYDEDLLVHIHPRVEGWIEKLYVKASGNPVAKNQPLYELYSPSLVNAQEELVLALERKNSRLIRASEDRLKALQFPKKAISDLKRNRKVKQQTTFYSPQSGVIDNLNIREGFFVKPGTTIMSIGKLDNVWVDAEIFERQSAQVKAENPVTMTVAFLPGAKWLGKVDYVYPTLDPKTRTIKVRLKFENKDYLLKPNMFAEIEINSNAVQSSIVIPKEALIRTGNSERVVLALGDGRFKSIEVKVGRFSEKLVEVLSGLNVGERVVSSAQFLLDSESSKTSDFRRMNSNNMQVESVEEQILEEQSDRQHQHGEHQQ